MIRQTAVRTDLLETWSGALIDCKRSCNYIDNDDEVGQTETKPLSAISL
jgi:hypothetical protein